MHPSEILQWRTRNWEPTKGLQQSSFILPLGKGSSCIWQGFRKCLSKTGKLEGWVQANITKKKSWGEWERPWRGLRRGRVSTRSMRSAFSVHINSSHLLNTGCRTCCDESRFLNDTPTTLIDSPPRSESFKMTERSDSWRSKWQSEHWRAWLRFRVAMGLLLLPMRIKRA